MTESHVALVTGASSGIGEAAAVALAEAGWTVVGAARRLERLESLRTKGVTPHVVDVSDDDSMVTLVDDVIAEHGRIDVLVNNAGYSVFGAVEDVPVEVARRQLEVNVLGLSRMSQLVLPHMRAAGAGRIINIASVAGHVSEPLGGWYHASKYAVEALSDAMRMELAPHGVRVAIIEPGAIRTEFGDIAADSLAEYSGSGAYAAQARRMARAHERMFGADAADVDVVVDAIVHAATARRPRSRYQVPASARAMVAATKVVPSPVMDAVMGRMFGTHRR
ncbi:MULTISPECIES: oxidoreductase [Janibacter]|uniref:Short-chain dehydrogenase n=1 Tax=Janibacter indicus TaxID=857417 RepID=A0A1L3MDT3_9MICO|nr:MULTISPECIES: oxidoreductase [Janibacter]APH00493.1 short-chain dehydrogenase [Janibacter indicus]QNF94667.1 SDR family NAD(P)-dependent oxidoreductase [Janibacter sp. YB324]